MFQFTQKYNATTDANTVVCLYPMSGQYEIMQRVLYYALLIFAVCARKQQWLVAGAVASALTYSGTAAIHSIVLAGISRDSLPDLDAFGIWALANSGYMIMLPAAEFSKQLRESPARPVFKFWGFLMMLGTIMTTVALLRKYPEENACSTPEGALLTSPTQWNASAFNCTYACFSTQQLLRSPSQIVVVTKQSLLGIRSSLMTAVLCMNYGFTFLGGSLAFFAAGRKKTKAELSEDLRDVEASIESFDRDAYTSYRAPFDGGGDPESLRQTYLDRMARIKHEIETGEYQSEPYVGLCGAVSPVLFLVVVIMIEVIIPESDALAFQEPTYAVGQWSGYVSILLVLIASGITQLYLPRYNERQETLAKEDDERKEKIKNALVLKQRQDKQDQEQKLKSTPTKGVKVSQTDTPEIPRLDEP